MDVEFKLVGEISSRRAAYRERVRGLAAHVEDGTRYLVHDVSARGLALVDREAHLRQGQLYRLSLAIGSKVLITGLPVTVVRQATPERNLAGVAFGELNRRQEAWLDKLVLEIQKRRIDLRKTLAAADNLEDEKKTDRADP